MSEMDSFDIVARLAKMHADDEWWGEAQDFAWCFFCKANVNWRYGGGCEHEADCILMGAVHLVDSLTS